MQNLVVSIWNGGKQVVPLAFHGTGTYLFDFLQDKEINMMLQDPSLVGNYDVLEEGMVEFDTRSFIKETTTTTDKISGE